MKIAVCFSGQMRTALDAAPHLLNFFGDLLPDIDFFIHTWGINQYKRYFSVDHHTPPIWRPNTSCKEKPIEKISNENLSKYKEIYNPKKMVIDVYDEQNTRGRPWMCGPLWWSAKKSIRLCVEYCNETSTKYDVVIKMRPDILFNTSTKLSNILSIYNLDKSKLYSSCVYRDRDYLDDMVLLGTMPIMLTASIFMDNTLDISVPLYSFLKNAQIDVDAIYMQGLVPYRPETKLIRDLNMEECELHRMVDMFWYACDIQEDFALALKQDLYENSDLL